MIHKDTIGSRRIEAMPGPGMSAVTGFTLTELLVVIILIGILAGLAIPKFGKTTDRAMELEASLALEQIYQLQSIYFLRHKKYCGDLAVLGFEQEALIGESEEGRARYLIHLDSADHAGYSARAEPKVEGLNAFTMDQTGTVKVRP